MIIFITGLCLMLLTSVTALANTGGGQSPAYPGQQPIDMGTNDEQKPNEVRQYSEEIYQKHLEINSYVFEDHIEEIEKRGFKVTHTGPYVDHVEIGITPYSEENADFLYEIFGRDMFKVVEGQQAILLDGAADDLDYNIEIVTTSIVSTVDDQASKSGSSTLIYITIVLMFLGGSIIFARKIKLIK